MNHTSSTEFNLFLLDTVYNIPSFIFVVDPESGLIIHANDYMKDVLENDCVNKTLKELFYIPEQISSFTGICQESRPGSIDQTEFYDDRSDSWYQVRERVIPWFNDESWKIVITMTEINALKSMQNDLSEAHAELAIKNLELEKLSKVDRLTQLFNRTHLDEVIEHEFLRAERYGTPFSLIIADCDKFKLVNDTHGHLVGDQVLIDIAKILQDIVRATDTVGRWGGEEFMIVLPETTLHNAMQVAEKLRSGIAQHVFPVVGHKTTSFGVSEYRQEDRIKILISRTDEALYQAKEQGRNRVIGV